MFDFVQIEELRLWSTNKSFYMDDDKELEIDDVADAELEDDEEDEVDEEDAL